MTQNQTHTQNTKSKVNNFKEATETFTFLKSFTNLPFAYVLHFFFMSDFALR